MVRSSKRPIDQSIINMFKDNVGNSQTSVVIRTSGMAETLIRIIIRGGIAKDSDPGLVAVGMAIVLVRDGQSVGALNLGNSVALYTPEQDVLWFYAFRFPNGSDVAFAEPMIGDIRAMRKMRKNDTLHLILLTDSTTNGISMFATVRSWYKQ